MAEIINSFPGYEFKDGKNMYRGVDLGFGGYVYAEPGMYGNVALLDVASMHPNSIRNLNAFGDYTKNFTDILDARVYIKHGDYEPVRKMFNGKLAKYLDDETTAGNLAQALKIAINSVYGLTSANFPNPFRDIRNKNNIVALRGALFMKTLQDEIADRGFTVAHVKTDSIKIPDATPEIIDFVFEFGKKYGYDFEHEATYDRMCLVNNAVYIAKYKDADECEKLYGYIPGDNKKKGNTWTATGKQFAVPYLFKSLFSKEPIELSDMSETFTVKSALYLDMNETLPNVEHHEKELDKLEKLFKKGRIDEGQYNVEKLQFENEIAKGHDYRFVGKVGNFCPILPGKGGGILVREQKGKYYAATGTTGFRWLESEKITEENKDIIDHGYYHKLMDEAIDSISEFGDYEWFVSDDPYIPR